MSYIMRDVSRAKLKKCQIINFIFGHFRNVPKIKTKFANNLFRFGIDRRSSRRGLLGRSNCILSRKSVPQGACGQIKLYFELEKRRAGAFWADQIVF